MVYESVLSAVVSALAAEAIDNTSKQAWQRMRAPGEEVAKAGAVTGELRTQVDCWVFARLHSQLIPRHWNALVAKYGTHAGRKVAAIGELKAVVATPAPALFLYKAVTTWAIPKLRGVRHLPPAVVSVEIPLDAPASKKAKIVSAAIEAERVKRKRLEERAGGMIVLKDSFYDMNTWDPDGRPESTRREWRRNIHKVLDEMLAEAMDSAGEILRAEGLLLSEAA
ncbi:MULTISPECIES: hypothetical protein [Pseudomonas]|uniref:hypothetical protein n=1 Tax=Pseudomonas TaxID=286 RepID=UPI000D6F7561|nr:hypothetical protein [Pseudomonas sp. RW407]PWU29550.1 hypothetical protein DK254_15630 [Pseudomonas sp. RW407]